MRVKIYIDVSLEFFGWEPIKMDKIATEITTWI